MQHFRRIAFLGLAGVAIAASVSAQGTSPGAAGAAAASEFLQVPANVKAEGLPPIPASTADTLAPYA